MGNPNQTLFIGIGVRPEDDVAIVRLNRGEACVGCLNVCGVGVVDVNPLLGPQQDWASRSGRNQVNTLINRDGICRKSDCSSGCYVSEKLDVVACASNTRLISKDETSRIDLKVKM